MTNLDIHIETSVHCLECRDTIEYFRNGPAIKLQHDLYGIRGFETDAVQFFVEQGWQQQSDGSWLCRRHNATSAGVTQSQNAEALRRAA